MTKEPTAIALRIIRAREELGMNTHQLAKAAGLSSSTVWDIENGTTQRPSYKAISKLAKVIGIPITDFDNSIKQGHASEDSVPYGIEGHLWNKAGRNLCDRWEVQNAGEKAATTTALHALWPDTYKDLIRWLDTQCRKKNAA